MVTIQRIETFLMLDEYKRNESIKASDNEEFLNDSEQIDKSHAYENKGFETLYEI